MPRDTGVSKRGSWQRGKKGGDEIDAFCLPARSCPADWWRCPQLRAGRYGLAPHDVSCRCRGPAARCENPFGPARQDRVLGPRVVRHLLFLLAQQGLEPRGAKHRWGGEGFAARSASGLTCDMGSRGRKRVVASALDAGRRLKRDKAACCVCDCVYTRRAGAGAGFWPSIGSGCPRPISIEGKLAACQPLQGL